MNKPQPKILFVEDELSLAEIIKDTLESQSFTVLHVSTTAQALQGFAKFCPDLILLDVTLPDGDGYRFARTIRGSNSEVPIFFLTSRTLPRDVVAGFESGGNDYLKKPFNIEELLVRIRVLLSGRRTLLTQAQESDASVAIGAYQFAYLHASLQRGGKRVALTAREAELLQLLVLNRNRVLERSVILKQIWGTDDFFAGRSMDVFITKLRRHLRDDPTVKIMNVRGVGYKLIL